MPTENRSSNTEMVSVPRDLLQKWQRCALRWKIDIIGIEIMDVLAKPADQHQGEPVAYADPRSFENLKSFGRLGGIYLHEWMWAEPEPGMVPLYTRPAQGEPVAYLCKSEGAKWLQYGSKVGDPWKPGEVEVTPLFAHADPGEVERLIAQCVEKDALIAEMDRIGSAQMAERDALLRESYAELLAIKAEIGFRGATIALIGRIDATLSVSADPESKS